MDPVARTSLYTAMLRVRESARSDPLFSDPFAEALAGPQGRELLAWMEARAPGVSEGQAVAIRTKFYDDTLGRILVQSGTDQLIFLAAGLDTRAFRLPLPPELTLTPGAPDDSRGGLLENFVLGELSRQLTWPRTSARLYHYRDRDNYEVDGVLEDNTGQIVGSKSRQQRPYARTTSEDSDCSNAELAPAFAQASCSTAVPNSSVSDRH